MAEPIDMTPGWVLSELDRRMDAAARHWLTPRELGSIPVLEARLPGRFRACFTTRVGPEGAGVSSPFDLRLAPDDEVTESAHNRDALRETLDRRLLSPAQVHGVRVAGASEYVKEEPGSPCDGLTLHPDIDAELAAVLLFADCVPVVLCGEVDMAVAHGGWRGILGGIVQQAGRSTMGAPATAIVGPSIGPCCFEVGPEVAEAFARRYGEEVVIRTDGQEEVSRVDLWEAVARAASELGVQREHVINPRLCTSCNPDLFFSHRKEGAGDGRHACVGWIAG